MKITLFIIGSSLALLILLFIQIDWIFKSADLKEEQFNQKSTMALSRTVEELCSNEAVCRAFKNCLLDSKTGECRFQINANERNKVDSILNHYLKFYHINLNYIFEIINPDSVIAGSNQKRKAYSQSLQGKITNQNMELKLFFPEQREYIMAEMGPMFISSILLILIIITLFGLTINSLKKEKTILKETKDFVNNMTHELRTPITNIALASNFLVRNSLNDLEKIKLYSEVIQVENKKLNQLVERTLTVASLERGELIDLSSKINIHEVIKEAIQNLSIQIKDKGGEFHISYEAKEYFILGDRAHIAGIFSNLLDNAIKYTINKPMVSVKTYNSENNIVITISDNGIGIPQKNHNQIFESFYRIYNENTNSIKGYGLGLAYVKKVIEAHQGKICLSSIPGEGSQFDIFLPLTKV